MPFLPEIDEESSAEPELTEYEDSIENGTEINANKTLEKREVADGQVLDELSFEDVILIYDLCRYEHAREPEKVSVWCAAFNQDDLEVFEYYNELEYNVFNNIKLKWAIVI